MNAHLESDRPSISELKPGDDIKISNFFPDNFYSTPFTFKSKEVVKEKIRKFKLIVETTDLTNKIIDHGLSSKFRNFEDSLQYYCAAETGYSILVTRNVKDF